MSLSKPKRPPLEVLTKAKRPALDADYERCIGMRLFLDGDCNHQKTHNEKWRHALQAGSSVEAGTLNSISPSRSEITVVWDCGATVVYGRDEWRKLRVLDSAATGYHALGIICDHCQQPIFGFSFRCCNKKCTNSPSLVFDLCFTDYCGDKHSMDNHLFKRVIPTQFETSGGGDMLPSRHESESSKARLYGIFPKAKVRKTDPGDSCSDSQSPDGVVARIVHDGGWDEVTKAKYWNCVAEVDWNPHSKDRNKKLAYCKAGQQGKVEIKSTEPTSGGTVYRSHFPSIDLVVMRGFVELWNIQKRFTHGGSDYGYGITSGEGENKFLHINLTDLVELTGNEEFWGLDELDHHLEFIDLLHNRFESLPQVVETFSDSLKVVGFAFNRFDSIPDPLFQCQKLETINMYTNLVRVVDRRIAQLNFLTLLELGNNKIEHLPDVFDSLSNLEILLLEYNFLTALPQSVATLKRLKRLGLANNFLKVFPSTVLHLEALQELTLAKNRIQLLPDEAKPFLDGLHELSLDGNPLQDQTIVGDAQTMSLLDSSLPCDYLIPQPVKVEDQTKSLRVLVVGECGSGKTSLVQALCCDKYITPMKGETHEHTVGIDRYKWSVNCSGKTFDISVWDFAGEKTYSMINQLFLSDNVLVWIVINLKQLDYNRSVRQWLKAVMSHSVVTKVWIVCTHSDHFSNNELRRDRAMLGRNVREECEDAIKIATGMLNRLQDPQTAPENGDDIEHYKELRRGADFILQNLEVLDVTNTYSRDGHPQLSEKVMQLLSSNGFGLRSSPLPEAWVKAELHLKELAREKVTSVVPEAPIMQIHDVVHHLRKVVEKEECQKLLKYFHHVGEILLFRTSPTVGMVVLDPSWLVFVLQSVFHHDFPNQLKDREYIGRLVRCARMSGVHLSEQDIGIVSDNLSSTGIIPSNLLYNLWYSAGVREYFKFLMSVLQRFGLAYELEGPPENPSYLFPWLLNEHSQADHCSLCHVEDHQGLVVKYEFNYPPFGLFERYIVRVLCLSDIIAFSDIGRHHISGETDILSVHIHHSPNDKHSSSKFLLCCVPRAPPLSLANSVWSVMSSLIQELENLLKSLPSHGSSSFIQCPLGIQMKSKPHFLYLSPFLRQSGVHSQMCLKCKKDVRPFMMIPTQGTSTNVGTRVTFKELLKFELPESIGDEYMTFGTFLLEDGSGKKVNNIVHKHHRNPEQINLEILQKWLAGGGKQPVTWATLVEVLIDAKLTALAHRISIVKCCSEK